jgi:hypothetical protein
MKKQNIKTDKVKKQPRVFILRSVKRLRYLQKYNRIIRRRTNKRRVTRRFKKRRP